MKQSTVLLSAAALMPSIFAQRITGPIGPGLEPVCVDQDGVIVYEQMAYYSNVFSQTGTIYNFLGGTNSLVINNAPYTVITSFPVQETVTKTVTSGGSTTTPNPVSIVLGAGIPSGTVSSISRASPFALAFIVDAVGGRRPKGFAGGNGTETDPIDASLFYLQDGELRTLDDQKIGRNKTDGWAFMEPSPYANEITKTFRFVDGILQSNTVDKGAAIFYECDDGLYAGFPDGPPNQGCTRAAIGGVSAQVIEDNTVDPTTSQSVSGSSTSGSTSRSTGTSSSKPSGAVSGTTISTSTMTMTMTMTMTSISVSISNGATSGMTTTSRFASSASPSTTAPPAVDGGCPGSPYGALYEGFGGNFNIFCGYAVDPVSASDLTDGEDGYPADDFAGCADLCEVVDGCTGFSFRIADKTCYVHSGASKSPRQDSAYQGAVYFKSTPDPVSSSSSAVQSSSGSPIDSVSSSSSSPSPSPTPAGPLCGSTPQGQNVDGYDIFCGHSVTGGAGNIGDPTTTDDLEGCIVLCEENPDCTALTFRRDISTCYMSKGLAGTPGLDANSDTAVVSSDPVTTSSSPASTTDSIPLASSMTMTSKAVTPEGSSSMTSAAFTISTSSVPAGPLCPSTPQGASVGGYQIYCGKSATGAGRNIGEPTVVNSLEECIAICSATPGCTVADYAAGIGKCYISKGLASTPGPGANGDDVAILQQQTTTTTTLGQSGSTTVSNLAVGSSTSGQASSGVASVSITSVIGSSSTSSAITTTSVTPVGQLCGTTPAGTQVGSYLIFCGQTATGLGGDILTGTFAANLEACIALCDAAAAQGCTVANFKKSISTCYLSKGGAGGVSANSDLNVAIRQSGSSSTTSGQQSSVTTGAALTTGASTTGASTTNNAQTTTSSTTTTAVTTTTAASGPLCPNTPSGANVGNYNVYCGKTATAAGGNIQGSPFTATSLEQCIALCNNNPSCTVANYLRNAGCYLGTGTPDSTSVNSANDVAIKVSGGTTTTAQTTTTAVASSTTQSASTSTGSASTTTAQASSSTASGTTTAQTTTTRVPTTTTTAAATTTTQAGSGPLCPNAMQGSTSNGYTIYCNRNVGAAGGNINNAGTAGTSLEACIAQCSANALCTVANFRIDLDLCFLGQGTVGAPGSTSDPNTDAAIKQSGGTTTTAPTTTTNAATTTTTVAATTTTAAGICPGAGPGGTGYNGYTVYCARLVTGASMINAGTSVASLDLCLASCTANSACTVADYRTDTGVCYLWQGTPGLVSIVEYTDNIAAVKNAGDTTTTTTVAATTTTTAVATTTTAFAPLCPGAGSSGTLYNGFNVYCNRNVGSATGIGSGLGGTASIEGCVNLCKGTQGCTVANYRTDSLQCYLGSGQPGAVSSTADANTNCAVIDSP